MAIFCSFAISVSMKLVPFSSSIELSRAPGDLTPAAKKRMKGRHVCVNIFFSGAHLKDFSTDCQQIFVELFTNVAHFKELCCLVFFLRSTLAKKC